MRVSFRNSEENSNIFETTSSIPTNNWHEYLIKFYSDGYIDIFQDQTEMPYTTVRKNHSTYPTQLSRSNIYVGKNSDSSSYIFDGEIDEFMVYAYQVNNEK